MGHKDCRRDSQNDSQVTGDIWLSVNVEKRHMQLGFDGTQQLVWNNPKDPDGLQGENRIVCARDKAFFKTLLWNATRDWPYELFLFCDMNFAR